MKKKILVVGDPHARPNTDQRRFDALSQFIIDKRPDHVVCIGDLADMDSLSHYGQGSANAEGRRYLADIEAANEAIAKITVPVKEYSAKLRQKHRARYEPNFHITIGNHENRILRTGNETPSMNGFLSLDDLDFKIAGWNVVPFLQPLEIENICFQHYFTSGVMGRPISGSNHARSLINKNFVSSVCGHSHLRDYSEDVNAFGRRIFGLVAGCYDENPHGYTTEQDRWWSGLVMLHECEDGQAEPAWYSMDYVLKNYL